MVDCWLLVRLKIGRVLMWFIDYGANVMNNS